MKYHLEDLVAQTESYLEDFTLESVFPILIEADRLSAMTIRDNAIRFILNHWGFLARSIPLPSSPPHSICHRVDRLKLRTFPLRYSWN
jgi:hypothetical protein